jgi:hypothetical protein
MNELDRWVYFDGPEPEQVRALLDALREESPEVTEDEQALAVRRIVAALEPSAAPEAAASEEPLTAPIEAVTMARAGQLVPEVAEEEPPATATAPVSAPAEAEVPPARAAVPLAGTGLALDLPREAWEARGALPFREASPAAPKAAKTMQVPVMRTTLGDTTPIGDDTLARAVAAVPFLGSTLGSGTVPFPRLTVQQYASFHVELTLWPERKEVTFQRYRVMHEAGCRALQAHWEEVFRAKPEERAVFERAASAYAAYWREGFGR